MQAGINKLADYCWVLTFVGRQANNLSALGSAMGQGGEDIVQPLI
jgi:hypothetical protein